MTVAGLSIARPRTIEEATALAGDARFSLPLFKAGAIDLMDHMKEGLLEPDLLIDVRRVTREGRKGEGLIEWDDSRQDTRTIRIAAGTTLAEIGASSLLKEHAPALAEAAQSAATPQVRNVATLGGNLLQRPRCWYYRSSAFDCLKKGGSRCFAADGENKFHAIFGEGPCHIVHPSNVAPVLQAMGGRVHTTTRVVPINELYHMPEDGLKSEHNLDPDELVTHVTLTPSERSGFYSIKEKESFDWPLVFAAVSLSLEGETIQSARVVAGAVAPVPWALPAVEQALAGVSIGDDAGLRHACSLATEEATPMSQNAYKLRLLPVAVRRATLRAAGRAVEDLHS